MSLNRNDVMVSIICLAYNHEAFIKKTLDSFVNQKTNFKYEVIIHDDASTDRTADIIREYERLYPEIIRPIYQINNQHSQHISIIDNFVFPKLHGKYIAWCEGDDFWTDKTKLQQQVDALENNSSCGACISKVAFANLSGSRYGRYAPQEHFETGVISGESFVNYCLYPSLNNTMAYQISGFMIRSDIYSDYISKSPEYRKFFKVGDVPVFLYAGTCADVYYIDSAMSNYRTSNSSSWSGKNRADTKRYVLHYDTEIKALYAFDSYTDGKYHKCVEKAVLNRKFRIYEKTHDIKQLKQREMSDYYKILTKKRIITHYLFHYFPFICYPAKSLIQCIAKKRKQ